MRHRGIGQVVLALVMVVVAPASGGAVYVDGNALPGGGGASWATAHKYLQDGLASAKAQATGGPVEICLAQGVYRPDRSEVWPGGTGDRTATFELAGGMSLIGGYAGITEADPNHRDPNRYRTILSGDLAGNDADVTDPRKLRDELTRADNSGHVATIVGPATLEGVTITGGHAPAESADGADPHAHRGGGLYIAGEGVTIRNCVLRANVAEEGGGLCAESAGAVLTGCTFEGNAAAWGGGICSLYSQSLEIANCLLTGNTAFSGGAACYSEGGMLQILNCTAVGNRAPEGSFLLDITARPPRGNPPPGIRVDSCILANGGNEVSNSYTALTIQYTNVPGGRSAVIDPQRALVWASGNVDADPCFADPGHWDANGTPEDPNDDFFVAGDYHLKSQTGRWDSSTQAWVQDAAMSPCIDAGNPAVSFESEPAPNGSRVNMGVYGGTPEAGKSDVEWSFVTTQGAIAAEGLGIILPHEHIFTDLRGPTTPGYGQADPADVVRVMKPLLVEARLKGVGVLFECSSIGVGRNAPILARVSEESGLPVVVPTGVYGRDNFAPPEHRSMSEDELTTLFVSEIRDGIEDTGIRAGFIKIATGSGALTALEEKFLRAAGRAASETGAAVASHSPRGSNASRQASILASIDPAVRFIWVHAQNESNRDLHRQLASLGTYIEFDNLGWNPGQDAGLITAIQELLAAGYGDRILLSHDAGWYRPGVLNGGSQKGYTYLVETFIPKLRNAGVDDGTIRMITETNPIRAFGFKTAASR